MNNKIAFDGFDDLVENPTARIPICLCLDTSESMGFIIDGDIEETGRTGIVDGQEISYVTVKGDNIVRNISNLQKGIDLFINAIREDELAVYSAEICIVTFDSKVKCLQDFSNVDQINNAPNLKAEGETAMGEGVIKALNLLEERKQRYKDAGVDYYQPWLILMTDGTPTGDSKILDKAINKVENMTQNRKLTIFPIGIGNNVDWDTLSRFSPDKKAIKLDGLKFSEFFSWLSKSVSKVSQSMPGEPLDLTPMDGWTSLD